MKKTALIFSIGIASIIADNNLLAKSYQEVHKNTIIRLDKDLLKYINSPLPDETKSMTSKHPLLLPALNQTITNTSNVDGDLKSLQSYFSHPALKKVYTDAVNMFYDSGKYEDELNEVLQIAKRELTPQSDPKFAFHVSGFKENTIYVSNIISISIDKYMGRDYSGYKGYFSGYQLQQMQPKMISRDLTKAWLMAEFIKTENTNGYLLDEMVENGKLLYALSILLPNYTDHDLIGYTSEEENWCTNNHKKIWDNIVKKNHLYTTDRHIINAYFDNASSAKTGVKDAPVLIGSWIGFQIVKQYAKTTNQPLKSLLSIDAKTILKDAKYRQ